MSYSETEAHAVRRVDAAESKLKSALTAFRALSQRWGRRAKRMSKGSGFSDPDPQEIYEKCKTELDALLVSLSVLKE